MTELEDIKRAYERRVDKMRGNNDRASVDRYKQTHDALFAGMRVQVVPVEDFACEQDPEPAFQRFVKAVSGATQGVVKTFRGDKNV